MKKSYAVVVSGIDLNGFPESSIRGVHGTVVAARNFLRTLLPADRKWTEKISANEYVTREGSAFLSQRGYKLYQVIELPKQTA